MSATVRTAEALPLGEVLGFMRLIRALDHAMETASKRLRADHGITGPQRLVMQIVGRFPGLTAGQLADTLYLDPSTLTGVLLRLQEKGLVARRADPRDGRRAMFGLTARGRRLNVRTSAAAAGTVEHAVGRLLSRLPRSRLEATRGVLSALADKVGAGAGAGAGVGVGGRGATPVRSRRSGRNRTRGGRG